MNVDFQTLAIVSVLTTLTTECIKQFLNKSDFNYVSNIIAAIVSVVLSAVIVVIRPIIMDGVALSAPLIYSGVVTAFFGVLCACLTFDKVTQALKGLK